MERYLVEEFYKADHDAFERHANAGSELELLFPLSSVGFTQSSVDIVQDYSMVSYCCETIAPFISVISSGYENKDRIHLYFRITCKSTDTSSLREELAYFSEVISQELTVYDDIDVISFWATVAEYEESFDKRVFHFPDLINGYWANLVNQGHSEIASEYHKSERKYFNKLYRKYPEQSYLFWRNPLSIDFADPIYFSTENWIIPPGTDLNGALALYSGIGHTTRLEQAEKVHYNGSLVLVSDTAALYFRQLDQLFHSIKCTALLLAQRHSPTPELHLNAIITHDPGFQGHLFKDNNVPGKKAHSFTRTVKIDTEQISYHLSELGDIVVAGYKDFKYVFFSESPLSFEQLKELNKFLYPAYAKTQTILEASVTEECKWPELDDEKFEELCYDILYCDPRFDSNTIQKMGNSRSRDGGRDIVIKTRTVPGRPPELYVFQCKYLSTRTSLSAAKLPNAANVIMQYGAQGYGVFTTTVIDATLYDMLAGFVKNGHLHNYHCWSRYELERFLNRHQMIKRKYFTP
ncbi:restriction endonuclease [Hymenobacter sp. BT635]|uniref:Restriction endonuclease n=1 Tax=Hymenobacter nitidus TaxID=2880929 RepID=A0ABS8AIU6_9BACT|nr:restriction endonuclease [Hymenobacter nitidus]MCB2380353.1 restriction endonuclease [Hymenobacter nitidus]